MLSASQIEQFNVDGFLVVEDVVDAGTLAELHDEYDDLLDRNYRKWHDEGLVGRPLTELGFWDKLDQCCASGLDWFQPMDISLPHSAIEHDTPMHFGPAVFRLVTHPAILDIAESLIGGEITSNPIQHVRIKPPERIVPAHEQRAHVVSTDWHQDRGVTLESADETEMVTVWVAVTDATVENGCLQVMPRMHKEMFPHCTKQQVGITDTYLAKDGAIPVPVPAGGVVLLHPLTPHASLRNSTNEYRWSFDLRYNVTGQSTGRDQFPNFVARSLAEPASELRDWRVWKQMWVDCRSRLSSMPHIPQHRWPSDGPFCA